MVIENIVIVGYFVVFFYGIVGKIVGWGGLFFGLWIIFYLVRFLLLLFICFIVFLKVWVMGESLCLWII